MHRHGFANYFREWWHYSFSVDFAIGPREGEAAQLPQPRNAPGRKGRMRLIRAQLAFTTEELLIQYFRTSADYASCIAI
jgi:hypothetical protein